MDIPVMILMALVDFLPNKYRHANNIESRINQIKIPLSFESQLCDPILNAQLSSSNSIFKELLQAVGTLII